MHLKRGIATLMTGALFVGLLTGCTKKEPESVSNGGTSTPPSGKRIKVVYIPKNTGNPYFDSVIEGFKKAAAEQNFDFKTVAPATTDANKQIEFINQQVQQKVDAIAISPDNTDTVGVALKEAMAKGIKVVTVDADLTGHEDGRDAAVLPTDFGALGASQIELMSSLMGGKGEFAILSATTDAPNQNAWIAGMKTALKDPKYKDLKLVEVAFGDDKPDKSLTEAQGLLTKYPNLRGILAPTTVAVAAAAQAVETANAASRVQVTGLGTPNQMRRYVLGGTVQKFALWSPADMGYLAGCLITGLVNGTVKPAAGVSFKAGTLGERKLGDKNTAVVGPPTIFEKSNIEQYKF